MIEAITFDLWNTLFQNISYADIRKDMIKKFLEDKGLKISNAHLNQVFDNTFNFPNPRFKTVKYKHIYTKTIINILFDELKIELEIEERKEINNTLESVMLTNPPALTKGVFDTLSTLSVNYNIGMISDTHLRLVG